jgi:hypothetical protein
VRGVFGEGVKGTRPPARRVEKMPSRRDLIGVYTDAVAISAESALLVVVENAVDGPVKGSG